MERMQHPSTWLGKCSKEARYKFVSQKCSKKKMEENIKKKGSTIRRKNYCLGKCTVNYSMIVLNQHQTLTKLTTG